MIQLYEVYKIFNLDTKTLRLKVKGQWKISYAKAGEWGAVLLSDKTDRKLRKVTKDKVHYLLVRSLIDQEDIMIINIYT